MSKINIGNGSFYDHSNSTLTLIKKLISWEYGITYLVIKKFKSKVYATVEKIESYKIDMKILFVEELNIIF